ncbi:hypothetical protein CH302_02995 [Rhodococcus sp. 15-2388-1-1a]|uniref:hypothetical protein n=1 Tax=Nocardiaceae TaxID=85025 RepID=UPI00056D7ECB|nr:MULTISPECIES: hypothetical protein [Rhodococcus]OZF04385.1 hypothetical protein CH302_02995 [Rhodococcus sp. 15-2388-1-1a]
MEWVAKELCVAAASGACTAAVLIWSSANGRWWDLTLPAVIGGVFGLMVGLVAVAGGHYAVRTAAFWPPRTRNRWRHRFALCSAAAVMLVVGGLLAWTEAASGNPSLHPESLIVLGTLTSVSYAFAYVLAPSRFGNPVSENVQTR